MAFNTQTLGIASNVVTRTLLSPRDYFLTTMETWLATPKTENSQWVVMIESFPEQVSQGMLGALVDSVTNVAASFGLTEPNLNWIQKHEGTTGDADGWNQTLIGSTLGGYVYNNIMGCIFATEVNIPELDAVGSMDLGIENNGGFRKGVLTTGRTGYSGSQLKISFRETNSSFGDLLIRPWTFLTAHYGRLPGFGHKTNIIIMQYAKTYQHVTQIPSKIWQFEDCCPHSVQGESLKYSDTGAEIVKTTSWSFSKYYIRHNMYLPIADALQKSSFNNVLNSNLF